MLFIPFYQGWMELMRYLLRLATMSLFVIENVPFCQVDTLDTYGSPLSQVISYFSTTEAPKMQDANDLRVYHPFNSTGHSQPPPPEKPKMYLPNYLDHYLAPQTSKRIKRKPHFKIQHKPRHKAPREPRRRQGSSGVGNVR